MQPSIPTNKINQHLKMIPFSIKLLIKVLRIMDLYSMSQGPSWIQMILFVEYNYVMSAYVSNTWKYSIVVYITICVLLLLL